MPLKSLKPCNKMGCKELTREGYCPEHKPSYERNKEHDKKYDKYKRNNKSKAFYHSREWEKVRQSVLIRDHYLCKHCLDKKQIKKADVVDHIVPLLVDWSKRIDMNNLQSLCHRCHNAKTIADKQKYKG